MASSGVQPTVRFVLLEDRVPSKYFREDYQNIFTRVPLPSENLTCWDEKFKATQGRKRTSQLKGTVVYFFLGIVFWFLLFKTGFLCIPLSVLGLS